MTYCTSEDIIAAMAEQDMTLYTDDDGLGIPDAGILDRAIASASALVDSFISARYGAGLDPVPDLIKSMTVDISIYKIASRRGDAPEEFRVMFDDAVRLLERIASGKADIPGVAQAEDAGTADGAAAVVTRPQHFTGNGMEGY